MKFKIGDRVVIYTGDTEPSSRRIPGWVSNFCDSLLSIRTDAPPSDEFSSGDFIYAHPKQCRRLVRRKRVWIKGNMLKYDKPIDSPGWIEFIAVRKRKKK